MSRMGLNVPFAYHPCTLVQKLKKQNKNYLFITPRTHWHLNTYPISQTNVSHLELCFLQIRNSHKFLISRLRVRELDYLVIIIQHHICGANFQMPYGIIYQINFLIMWQFQSLVYLFNTLVFLVNFILFFIHIAVQHSQLQYGPL